MADPRRQRQVEMLFNAVAELPAEEQRVYLDAAAPEPAIRAEVEALLHHLDAESLPLLFEEDDPPLSRVGTTLGDYEITRVLGRGGMGEVFVARDRRSGEEVALKLLGSARVVHPDLKRRFSREARTISALNHPNIVKFHSVRESGDDLFMTMELIQGDTLSDRIGDGGMSLEQLRELAVPLVDAVSAAHQRGITHRDLKPHNVMVTESGQVKLLDFGLAKLAPTSAHATRSRPALTSRGQLLGTLSYMSPEQTRGQPADPRSDVFTLGVILYEMATGRRPFSGKSNFELIRAVREDTPPAATKLCPRLPSSLDAIISKCLAKAPKARYPTARELHNELSTL